jgi:hypothetical protein
MAPGVQSRLRESSGRDLPRCGESVTLLQSIRRREGMVPVIAVTALYILGNWALAVAMVTTWTVVPPILRGRTGSALRTSRGC